MILTTTDKLSKYINDNPNFADAFAALAELAAKPFAPGRHEVDGDRIFINAAEYDTRDSQGASMEFHKRYIDVMWMVSGKETIGIAPNCDALTVTKEYDAEGDYALAALPASYTRLAMAPGCVAILFPEDAHAPSLNADGVDHVQKLICKVRVD